MRLLVVSHFFSREGAGIGIVARELARGLARRGLALTWAASAPPPDEPLAGVTYLPMRSLTRVDRSPGFPVPVWTPASLARLREVLEKSDVLHLHDCLYFGNLWAFHAARRLEVPILVTQHIGAIPYRSRFLRSILALANRAVVAPHLQRADACVFVSDKVRRYFRSLVRFPREPSFIPNGVDHDLFYAAEDPQRAQLASDLGWSPKRLSILFVGRFVEKKGMDALRHAAQQLPDLNWIFVGWGPDDPSGWGLPQVRCLGKLGPEEGARCYRAADLLVLPSVGEGFPLVVQEAMASGTPCLISSDTAAGMPGVERVAWVASHEPASFTSALVDATASRQRLSELRKEAAAFARDQWDWSSTAGRYAEILSRITSPRAIPML